MSGSLTHGRFGQIWIDMSSAGTMALGTTAAGTGVLNLLRGVTDWTLDWQPDFVDVTCIGDTSKTSLSGLPNGSGDINGNWDFTGSGSLIKNILSPTATNERSMIIFPDISNYGTIFWSGKFYFGATTGGGAASAVTRNLKFTPGPSALALYP